MKTEEIYKVMDHYGALGVAALRGATPVEHGETAASWSYEVVHRRGYHSIRWFNSHREGDQHIAILLQYGHGTGTGGYVQGRDYIMPAVRPIFDQIDAEIRRAVTK